MLRVRFPESSFLASISCCCASNQLGRFESRQLCKGGSKNNQKKGKKHTTGALLLARFASMLSAMLVIALVSPPDEEEGDAAVDWVADRFISSPRLKGSTWLSGGIPPPVANPTMSWSAPPISAPGSGKPPPLPPAAPVSRPVKQYSPSMQCRSLICGSPFADYTSPHNMLCVLLQLCRSRLLHQRAAGISIPVQK